MSRWSWLRLSVCGVWFSVGCDGPPPASPEEPAQRAHEARGPEPAERSAEPAPDEPAPVASAAARLEVALNRVERRGDVVEIEVAMPRPLPPMSGSRPTLQVGDEVARHSRAGADGRLDRLVFTVQAAQFERMPTDAPMVVKVGPLSNLSAANQPRLADIAITVQGGAQ